MRKNADGVVSKFHCVISRIVLEEHNAAAVGQFQLKKHVRNNCERVQANPRDKFLLARN